MQARSRVTSGGSNDFAAEVLAAGQRAVANEAEVLKGEARHPTPPAVPAHGKNSQSVSCRIACLSMYSRRSVTLYWHFKSCQKWHLIGPPSIRPLALICLITARETIIRPLGHVPSACSSAAPRRLPINKEKQQRTDHRFTFSFHLVLNRRKKTNQHCWLFRSPHRRPLISSNSLFKKYRRRRRPRPVLLPPLPKTSRKSSRLVRPTNTVAYFQ